MMKSYVEENFCISSSCRFLYEWLCYPLPQGARLTPPPYASDPTSAHSSTSVHSMSIDAVQPTPPAPATATPEVTSLHDDLDPVAAVLDFLEPPAKRQKTLDQYAGFETVI